MPINMPEDYYCADNFYKKMTDLDSPRKNNDCYFYYYSKCAKGDNCTFRHEPSALGCETMCSFWKEGKCVNVHCNFRHMELRKNRKAIQCYWETQPGGCLKPHCPFLHSNPNRPQALDDSTEHRSDPDTDSADNMRSLGEKAFRNTPVDSLVVNFEEESDNESAPTDSPIKPYVKVKTLEDIKLERIQAESAAYYSYAENDSDDLRQRILKRFTLKAEPGKRAFESQSSIEEPTHKKTKISAEEKDFKIKTLEEIRAERAKRLPQKDNSDTIVTSTTDVVVKPERARKKIKLQRRTLFKEPEVVTTDSAVTSNDKTSEGEDVKIDEVLLLQDDDDASNVSIKDEERLLNELDDDDL